MKRFIGAAISAAFAFAVIFTATVFLPGCINLPTVTIRMNVGNVSYWTDAVPNQTVTLINDFINSSGLLENAVIKTPSSPEIPLTKQGIREKVAEALVGQGVKIPKFLLNMVKPRIAEISYIELKGDPKRAPLTHIDKLGVKLVVDQDPSHPLLDLSYARKPTDTDAYTIKIAPTNPKEANLLSQIKARGDKSGTVHAEALLSGRVPDGMVAMDVSLAVRVRVGFGIF